MVAAQAIAMIDHALRGTPLPDMGPRQSRVTMALNEWELWACANEMIRQHAFDAPIHAAMKADQMLERGDLDGAKHWQLIVHRINELLKEPEQRRQLISECPQWVESGHSVNQVVSGTRRRPQ